MKIIKTVILDSNPLVSYRLDNTVSNRYEPYGKKIPKPLLGKVRGRYSRFVPLQDSSQPVKDLLEAPETEVGDSKPVPAFKKILEAEKVAKFEPIKEADTSKVVDNEFVDMARKYVNTPQPNNKDSYEDSKEADDNKVVVAAEKNEAELGNVIQASQAKAAKQSRSKRFRKAA